ncbi:MAG: ZIP family metal transporter [Planctomycetota bacterium]|nr:ZIP family metal transporter [Planctomycetota bacterium]
MPERTLAILVSIALISLISVVGAALLLRGGRVHRHLSFLVALAAGALIGDVFLHLLPHAVEDAGAFSPQIGWGILGGLLGFFLIESLLHWHHHGEDVHDHEPGGLHSFGWMNLIGDALHNAIDGMLIAGAWIASPEAGLATSVAVLLHEVPQEFGDFGVLLHAGFSPSRALWWNLGCAASAFLGAGVVLAFGTNDAVQAMLVPIAAGGFLYIACSDLVPEMRRRARGKGLIMVLLALALGLGCMAALGSVEGLLGDLGHAHGHPHPHPH